MYRGARKDTGISREEAAFRLHVSPRALANYEDGHTLPPPEVVLGMSREYDRPEMTQRYCRETCSIGQAFGFEILNHVCLDPASVMLKLASEMREAEEVLVPMMDLAVNKRSREDFTQDERAKFETCLQELLDVEHVVEVLKVSLGHWCDIPQLVAAHNRKCWEHGYVAKEKDGPVRAAK